MVGNLSAGQPASAGFPVVPGSRLNPASWEPGPVRPARSAEEEWAHADSSLGHPPPPPHRSASSSRRNNTGREDQNKLRRPRVRGLGSAAMPVAARSAILVRPAYLPATDPPPVTVRLSLGETGGILSYTVPSVCRPVTEVGRIRIQNGCCTAVTQGCKPRCASRWMSASASTTSTLPVTTTLHPDRVCSL